MKTLIILIIASIISSVNWLLISSKEKSVIRINQVGYLTLAEKQAVIVNPDVGKFRIKDSGNKIVYEGELDATRFWNKSNEEVAIADFSELKKPGIYTLSYKELNSPQFRVADKTYIDILKASIKSYYYNRASTALEEKYAGKFKRPLSHPDTAVYVHASAATDRRPAGTIISSPYGWYDAGDYNKYIVNSGISTYTLLMAYHQRRQFYDTLKLNIPESDNNRADLLDEIAWNIKWMETMQDPNDGGVYHKLTTANFEGMIFPPDAKNKRYVVAKGTAAALDFSAVLAKASIVFKATDPNWSAELLEKAEFAWEWAIENPNVFFKNPKSDGKDYPSIMTGEYGDSKLSDEFFWAASELYLATNKNRYIEKIDFKNNSFGVPGWGSVETLGLISLVSSDGVPEEIKNLAIDKLYSVAIDLLEFRKTSPYNITMNEFRWGSNSDILNESMVLLNMFNVNKDKSLYNAALSGLDYVLGRNATGYSFVTGYGNLTPMYVHHRPSASDGIDEPIPGFLAGGPNPRNVDQDCGKDKYPALLPAKAYLDDVCSYSTNEIAINWNAPLVYVTGAIQAMYLEEMK